MQRIELCLRNLEHEVCRESFDISVNLFIQAFHGYFIKSSKVVIEHYFLPPNEINEFLDLFRYGCHCRRHMVYYSTPHSYWQYPSEWRCNCSLSLHMAAIYGVW